MIKYLPFLLLFSLPLKVLSQSVIENLESSNQESIQATDLPTETINKIAPSGRIFILTNQGQSFGKGDFITLVLESKLAARALVAKTEDKEAGIKVLKIYDVNLWNKIAPGIQVQVIRGDDSYYRKKTADAKAESLIDGEEGLFDDKTFLEENVELDENKNRLIKNDNIISAILGRVEGLDNDGNSQRYTQINGAWAYQIEDNIWAELSYGQRSIAAFPNEDLSTKITNITIRGKYTISAPFHSFLKPYVGFQIRDASSPQAGQQDEDNSRTDDELDFELQLVDDLKENGVVFGITWLKRLVPGWFVRVDLGSDIMSGGIALEF